MKKNNTYLADDEIDLGDIIKSLWREKILILSISIICGLASYLYASLQPQNFKTEITLRNAPAQIFEPFNLFNINNSKTSSSNNNIAGQFISDFKLNILSLDNLQSFLEQSGEFDNFKGYLKSINISTKEYYFKSHKFGEANILNRYFLIHPKELDGNIFLNKYVEFIKKNYC